MMKKIRMNCTATLDETFADFLLSRRAKGLAEKTLESYSSQWKAVARHLDTGTDIAALQKADADLTKNYDNFSPLAQMKAGGAKIKTPAKGR